MCIRDSHVTSLVKHELISSSTVTIDSFLTSKYDSAFYLGVSRDDTSDEFEVFKTSLVHNDSDAFISTSAVAKTGTNNHTTVTADISSGTVRLRGTGSSPTNSLAMYRIGLGDNDSSGYSGEQEASVLVDSELTHMTETAVNGIIATGSHTLVTGSTQTTVNQFATSKYDSAWYLVLSRNKAADRAIEFQFQKHILAQCTEDGSTFGSFSGSSQIVNSSVSDKEPLLDTDVRTASGNVRLTGRAGLLADSSVSTDNAVSFFRIGLGDNDSSGTQAVSGLAATKVTADLDSATATLDSFSISSARAAKYFISINNTTSNEVSSTEVLLIHDGTNAFITEYNTIISNASTTPLATFTADISGGNATVSYTHLTLPTKRIV